GRRSRRAWPGFRGRRAATTGASGGRRRGRDGRGSDRPSASRPRGSAAAAAAPPSPRPRPAAGSFLDLDPHGGGELPAERELALAEAHEQRPAEGLAVDDLEHLPERDALLGEVAELLGI